MKSAPQITPTAIERRGVSAVDHLGVVGRDIAKMSAAYQRLGFLPTDAVPLMGVVDGTLSPIGQDSAHVIFTDNYVELSGVTTLDPGHHLAPWLARHDGLHILAFGSADAKASHDVLAGRGLDVPAIQDAGRKVTYGQKNGEAKFKWFKAPDALGDEGFVCVVEQITPELVFQPPAEGHPNGALGVTGVTLLTDDTKDAVSRFGSYPGATLGNGNTLVFDHQTLTFLTPAQMHTRYPGLTTLTAPALLGFTVSVRDLGTTRALLDRNGVPSHDVDANAIWIHPDDACGTLLIFESA